MAKDILVRFIIEIGGKPVENVDKALNVVLKKLKDEKIKFKVVEEFVAEPKLDEKTTLYMGFLEISVKFETPGDVLAFIIDYTPTSIEVEEPEKIVLNNNDFTNVLNEMSINILNNVNQIRKLNAYIHMQNKKIEERGGSSSSNSKPKTNSK